jgi:hypothetical protein
MTVEVKLKTPGSQAERIHKRYENSGEGAKPNTTVTKGDGPQRLFTNIHLSGHYVDPSTAARECGPQHQRHADEATQQTTTYFRGHGKHEQEGENDD